MLAFIAIAAFALLAPSTAPPPAPSAATAGTVPSGFQETVALSGLTNPMVVRFANDGRVFVAEKSGVIKVFDSLLDTTPTVFADLSTKVHNFWDRGLLGMALDPGFPETPFVYVLYSYDHELGSASAPPRWGDACPTPPGPTTDGCVISGRLSRLQAAGNVMTGNEQVLVEDWCQQYPSHSVGTVEFGPDGALYASAGEGASFIFADYGQAGNPCGDPPSEGGALRAQDLRTSGDPVSLDGSIIRVHPATGAGLPSNPLATNADPNARRIIAHGLRNPFRFAFRPGTSELWVGDVGWNDWEEINKIDSPTDSVVENFGWPCYEGIPKQPGYDAANLAICTSLSPSAVTSPYFAYRHSDKVVPGETCPIGSSSIAGLAFEFSPTGGTFPTGYRGALFFADYTRDCIWVMKKSGSVPSPGHIETFVAAAANPVNLEFGPNGDLFYADFDGGTIRRIQSIVAPPTGTTFGPPTTYPTGSNAHGAALADFNGDGKNDIAVANSGSSTVSILLGSGNGSFGGATNFSTGSAPKTVAVADLTGDGVLDLATPNQNANTVSVLIGSGNGSFSAATNYPVCAGTHEVAVGNFNGDDKPDLAAACWGGTVISVLLGTGAGGFGSAINSPAGSAPHSLVARDFNGDGRGDLAIANHSGGNISVLIGRGDGSFESPVNYTVGVGPHSIRAGDFNADGIADLVTANDGADSVSVLLGTGTGTFGAATSFPTDRAPEAVAVGDFNADGKRDLVTANSAGNYPSGGPNPGGVSLLLGTGSGSFGAPTNYLAGDTPFAVAVGQIDADGQPDLVTANWFGNNASVLLNTTLQPPSTGTSYLSDLAWTSMTNGWGPVEQDTSNGDAAAGDGVTLTLNGTTYPKGLGTHAPSEVRYPLGANCSRFEASVGLDDEVGDNGTVIFQVYADATKVYDSGLMTGATATKPVDVSVAGAAELRLVVTDGGDNVYFDHADWALARIQCGSGGGDTTPPTVTATTPVNGATGVALGMGPTATFSETMNASTLNTSTFTLIKQGTSTPLPATVTYDSSGLTATLDPNASLEASTSYTATLEGGASGAKDVAGNALASDFSWTFTTGGGNQAPTAVVDTPPSTLTWKVGDTISFSGQASDPEQGNLPASALSWTLVMQHCPSNCHSHTIQTWPGVASGSFSAPDHEYPSHLELTLTATDAGGLTATKTVRLDPMTVGLTFSSTPAGLQLAVNGASSTTPFMRTVIVGSANSVSATSPQLLSGTTYEFSSWSDGGVQTHNIVAPLTPATYTATYVDARPRNTGLPTISGQARVGRTLTATDGTWTGSAPMNFAYQWLRCGTTALGSCIGISGATAKTYAVSAADLDFRLRVRVTATNAWGAGSATSNATGRVR